MRSYCRLKRGLVVFFLLYLVIAPLGFLAPNKEIFPFFSWFLFSAVPNPGPHYDVLILRQGSQSFQPPLSYTTAGGTVAAPNSITAYQFIQKMGRTRDAGHQEDFAELNRLFQRDFLRTDTRYQLVKNFYDPVERWHGKEPVVEVLQSFEVPPPSP